MDSSKTNVNKEPVRVGVYICRCGGNISDVIDVQRVAAEMAKYPNVVVAREYMFMCSDPGQNLIMEDIRNHHINRVVVSACSPSLHELTFRNTMQRAGLNPYLYEHVNIREQDSWVHKENHEAATEKAIFLTKAGVEKVVRQDPLDAIQVNAEPHVLVVGGGVAGLRSCLSLSKRGLRVTLIEKTPFLGGRTVELESLYPHGEQARDVVAELIKEVVACDNVAIYTNAEIKQVKGFIGNFTITLQTVSRGVSAAVNDVSAAIEACPQNVPDDFEQGTRNRKAIYYPYPGCYPNLAAIDWKTCTRCGKCKDRLNPGMIELEPRSEDVSILAGAIILATGFSHYVPYQGEFGYGELPQVVTLPQLVRLLAHIPANEKKFVYNNKKINSIAFIHCVGSRQVEGVHKPQADGRVNDYCSRVCCTSTLHMVNELKKKFPAMHVYNLYKDIRTYGRGHEEIYEQACKNKALFFRYTNDQLPEVSCDASNANACKIKVKDVLTWGEELEIPVDLVVLVTGMMAADISRLIEMLKLPVGSDRFLQEVHPKLRPVELANNGIFLAGTTQGPMDINEACAAAQATASKASILLAKKQIQLDPFIARVRENLCDGCGLCIPECSYEGALQMQDKKVDGGQRKMVVVNSALCVGCGACVAVCPHRALEIAGWTLDQFDAMIDAFTGK